MLDERSSVANASALAVMQGQATRSSGGSEARQESPGGTNFDDVFAEAFSDRWTVQANRQDQPPRPADKVESQRASSRKPAQPKKAANKADRNRYAQDAPAENHQPEPSPDRAADAPATQESGAQAQPEASRHDQPQKAADSPADAGVDAANSSLTTRQADSAAMTAAAQQAVSATEAQADVQALAGAAKASTLSADVMRPLRLLAQRQAAQLNVQATASQPSADQPQEPSLALANNQAGIAVTSRPGEQASAPGASAETTTGQPVRIAAVTQPVPMSSTEDVVRSLAEAASPLLSTGKGKTSAAGASPAASLLSPMGNQNTPQARPQADGLFLVPTGYQATPLTSASADISSLLPPDSPKTSRQGASAGGSSSTESQVSSASTAAARSDPSAGLMVDVRSAAPHVQSAGSSSIASKDGPATFSPSDVADNADRMAKIVYAAAARGQSVARMNLRPPELGDVIATVRMNQGRMDLKLEVGSESARHVVAEGLDRLRENLQNQGISLHSASVSVTPKAEPTAGKEHQWQGQDAQHQPAPHEQGGGQGQSRQQDRASTFVPDFAAVASPAGQEEEIFTHATTYRVSLNVVA